MLLQRDIGVNWADPEDGNTAAHVASARGNFQCISLLTQHNADLTLVNKDGWAPIHVACYFGNYSCITLLLAHGGVGMVNMRTADEHRCTPAMFCSGDDHVKCLALLLDREEADMNLADSYGDTAVHEACRYDQWKSLLFLIRRGADINLKNGRGHTPLDVARRFGHSSCVRTLTRFDAVGMSVEDLPPVAQADKVCMYVYMYICAVSALSAACLLLYQIMLMLSLFRR